jgi:acyl carrier protein
MSVPVDSPAQLARFPAAVHDAYRRFFTSGDASGLPIVVEAALIDFLPKRPGSSRSQPLDDRARLIEDLGYDSLAIAELVFFFEDLFKVTITTQEIRNVSTVGELRAFVARKLAATKASA